MLGLFPPFPKLVWDDLSLILLLLFSLLFLLSTPKLLLNKMKRVIKGSHMDPDLIDSGDDLRGSACFVRLCEEILHSVGDGATSLVYAFIERSLYS